MESKTKTGDSGTTTSPVETGTVAAGTPPVPAETQNAAVSVKDLVSQTAAFVKEKAKKKAEKELTKAAADPSKAVDKAAKAVRTLQTSKNKGKTIGNWLSEGLGNVGRFLRDEALPFVIEKGLPLALNALGVCKEVYEDELGGVNRAKMIALAQGLICLVEDRSINHNQVRALLVQTLWNNPAMITQDGSTRQFRTIGLWLATSWDAPLNDTNVAGGMQGSLNPVFPVRVQQCYFRATSITYSTTGPAGDGRAACCPTYAISPAALPAVAPWVSESINQGTMAKNVDVTVNGMAAGTFFKFFTAIGGTDQFQIQCSMAPVMARALGYLMGEDPIPITELDMYHNLLFKDSDYVMTNLDEGGGNYSIWPMSPLHVQNQTQILAWCVDVNTFNQLAVKSFDFDVDPEFPTFEQWDSQCAVVPLSTGANYRGLPGALWTLLHMEYPFKWRVRPHDVRAYGDINSPVGSDAAFSPYDNPARIMSNTLQTRIAGPVQKVLFVLVDESSKASRNFRGSTIQIGAGVTSVSIPFMTGLEPAPPVAGVDIFPSLEDVFDQEGVWKENWAMISDAWWSLGGTRTDWRNATCWASNATAMEGRPVMAWPEHAPAGTVGIIHGFREKFDLPLFNGGPPNNPLRTRSPDGGFGFNNIDDAALQSARGVTDSYGVMGLNLDEIRSGLATSSIVGAGAWLYVQIANKTLLPQNNITTTGNERLGTDLLAKNVFNPVNVEACILKHGELAFCNLGIWSEKRALPRWVKYPYSAETEPFQIQATEQINHLQGFASMTCLRAKSQINAPPQRAAAANYWSHLPPGDDSDSAIPLTDSGWWGAMSLSWSIFNYNDVLAREYGHHTFGDLMSQTIRIGSVKEFDRWDQIMFTGSTKVVNDAIDQFVPFNQPARTVIHALFDPQNPENQTLLKFRKAVQMLHTRTDYRYGQGGFNPWAGDNVSTSVFPVWISQGLGTQVVPVPWELNSDNATRKLVSLSTNNNGRYSSPIALLQPVYTPAYKPSSPVLWIVETGKTAAFNLVLNSFYWTYYARQTPVLPSIQLLCSGPDYATQRDSTIDDKTFVDFEAMFGTGSSDPWNLESQRAQVAADGTDAN